jgi:acyl-CoA thioester hydrolase
MSDTGQVHRTDIQVRFGDTDALGHVNNASFAAYAELARLDFLNRFGGSVRSLILASLYIDFRRQVSFTEAVYVETAVERIGTSSVTLAQTVFAASERAADVRSTVVYFDYSKNKSRPLTDDMRASVAPFLKTGSE